jgi:hypothetical protein
VGQKSTTQTYSIVNGGVVLLFKEGEAQEFQVPVQYSRYDVPRATTIDIIPVLVLLPPLPATHAVGHQDKNKYPGATFRIAGLRGGALTIVYDFCSSPPF